MPKQSSQLQENLRDLKYEQRLDQASLIASFPDDEQRVTAAVRMIRELAMQRVFDRFTHEQDTQLLDRFVLLAEIEKGSHPFPFGLGSVTKVTQEQKRLF